VQQFSIIREVVGVERKYEHLSMEDRSLIQVQLSLGFRPATIAAVLERARSTVVREMRRNGWQSVGGKPRPGCPYGSGYKAGAAHRRAVRLSASRVWRASWWWATACGSVWSDTFAGA